MLPARGGVYTGRVGSDAGKHSNTLPFLPIAGYYFGKKWENCKQERHALKTTKPALLVSPVSIVTLSQRLMRLWRRQSQPKADAIPTDGWRAPLAQ
jgi:hypothetical protein